MKDTIWLFPLLFIFHDLEENYFCITLFNVIKKRLHFKAFFDYYFYIVLRHFTNFLGGFWVLKNIS